MKITYLYDTPHWALHNLGVLLQEQLAQTGVTLECVGEDDWHAHPAPTDVLYLSYSAQHVAGYPYKEWCRDLVTTVHDPLEVSHFEDRADWRQLPLRELDLAVFDRVSAISAELTELLQSGYGIPAYRTPTWPTTAGSRSDAGSHQPVDERIVVLSSTNMAEYFPWQKVLRRFASWRTLRHYFVDHKGNSSLAQARGLVVRRRRKNITLLRALQAEWSTRPDVRCHFRYGPAAPVPRAQYEAELGAADIYVCTSHMEGGPLPVLEAVAAGLAVLSTPVGQVEEWVEHGQSGFICRSAADFTRALDAYAQDRDLLRAHRRRAAEIAHAAVFPLTNWVDFLTGRRSADA
jgi:glycosyltransferase involved in cell wall biosynthesis